MDPDEWCLIRCELGRGPRLSFWAHVRLVCELGVLAEKRCPQDAGHVSRSWWGSKSDQCMFLQDFFDIVVQFGCESIIEVWNLQLFCYFIWFCCCLTSDLIEASSISSLEPQANLPIPSNTHSPLFYFFSQSKANSIFSSLESCLNSSLKTLAELPLCLDNLVQTK